jgi:hypothetical protein
MHYKLKQAFHAWAMEESWWRRAGAGLLILQEALERCNDANESIGVF